MVGRIRAGGCYVRVGRDCLQYLKSGWNRKEGKGSKYSFNWCCEATLEQRWDNVISTLKQCWNDIVQLWKTVALTLCNVDVTLFQRWTWTLYQCCATLKIRFRILFHFQPWINVIWMVIYNVETTLIRRWNVGREVSMKKLILRKS